MTATSPASLKIRDAAIRLKLTMAAEFVPFSKSRNRGGGKQPSLNWTIRLAVDGRDFLTTDYMAGSGHAPSYKQSRQSIDQAEAVRRECETGRALGSAEGKLILPDLADVLHSLVSDAEAIDFASFEDWAGECDMDTDSRKAEATYRACLDIGLKLRAALGDAGLQELREACQDY